MAEDASVVLSSMNCPACGKTADANKKFCPSCGSPLHESENILAQPLLCAACGDELQKEDLFCGSCGARVQPQDAAPFTPASTFQQQEASRSTDSSSAVSPPTPAPTPQSLPVSSPEISPAKRPLFGAPLALGAVALLVLGFFGGKVFNDKEQNLPPVATPAPPPAATPTVAPASEPTPSRAAVATSSPSSVPPGPTGTVVTAEEFLNIRVFGNGASDSMRSATALRTRVEGLLDPVREAYKKELETSSQLMGVLILELTISLDGRVSHSASYATVLDKQNFQHAVQNLAQAWQFEPAPTGEVVVFYPLLFTPAALDPKTLMRLTKETLPGRYKLVASEPTSVRLQPSDDGEEVGKISPGKQVEIVNTQGDWSGVLSPKGKIGYVRKDAISSRQSG